MYSLRLIHREKAMGYEVDFLGVGDKSNSGDAITLRYGNLHGERSEQTVVVIDGGYKNNGQQVVDHIEKHYQTNKVDLVISTHPDQDHINGLETVLEQLEIGELWIHKAWEHNDDLADKFKDGRITDHSIGERLKENLNAAYDLVKLAETKNIKICEPFTGKFFENVKILGPSKDYYEELLSLFDNMPEVKKANISLFESLSTQMKSVIQKVIACWGEDKIDDEDGTSAKNNSSVITQIIVDNKRLIFTGDAGITALNKAADEIDSCTSDAKLSFFQVPHHGSRRNIGPTVLNRIIGKPVEEGNSRKITAIASSATEGEPKHPHKAVLNAFTHRGVKVLATRGNGIHHYNNAPEREGWSSMEPEQYYYKYDEQE